MNKKLMILLLLTTTVISFNSFGQKEQANGKKVYVQNVSDLMFQLSESIDTANNAFNNGVKTTYFFNYAEMIHIDLSNNYGMITGLSIRNVGMKTFDETIGNINYDKVKRRVFALGGSVAFKVGAFSKHSFIYAGCEYEIAFHYRQKLYDNFGKIIKQGEWLSTATNRFLPSTFIGYQLPSGFNIQMKYYLNDFLNNSYKGVFGDFTLFKKSQIICFILSYQLNKSKGETSILDKIEEKKGDIFDL